MVFFKHVAVLAALAMGAIANPLAQADTVTPCSVVKCREGTECKVQSGRAVCVPFEPQECGPTVCGKGMVCCNSSCGICTPPGGMCTQQFCFPTGPKCGDNQCYEGQECCNESCGICVRPGKGCTKQLCGREEVPEPEPEPKPEPIQCGKNTCDPESEYCCNESCGFCAAKDGGSCTEQYCLPDPPEGEKCGLNTCEKGEVCCNESCGICAPPDHACIDRYCEPEVTSRPTPPEEGDEKCGDNICSKGTVCCNASCGICLPPDMACIQIACTK